MPATHFLGARILTTSTTSTPPAAFSALPQHLPSPFSVIVPLSTGPYLDCMAMDIGYDNVPYVLSEISTNQLLTFSLVLFGIFGVIVL